MNLFTYGTLMDADIMSRVTGISCRSHKATLSGYERRQVLNEVYPAIFRQAERSVEGIVYIDLPSTTFKHLDVFEGALYTRTEVVAQRANGQNLNAYTYVISSRFEQHLSAQDWDFQHFLQYHKKAFQTF